MSNNRNLGNIATAITNATSGQVLTSQGSGVATFADAAGGSSVTTVTNVSGASDSLTAISSPSVGDIVFVTSTNGLFIRKSNGWFKIATVTNAQPTNLTGVSDSALAIDGTATTITLAATDPEGLTLTFSAAAKTGSSTTFSAALTDGNTVNALNGSTVIATVAQASNVFTIDPNTASNAGTIDITFSVTDGVNAALTSDGQFTLTFITIVTDSNHTTLLATATGTSDNNNITESSSNSHSITVNGDVTAGTFSPHRSGGYSTYFDGSGYLTIPQTSNVGNFGTGAFTVEFWFKPINADDQMYFVDFRTATNGFQISRRGSNTVRVRNGSTTLITSTSQLTDLSTWYHVCVHRNSSNELKLFVNGTQEGGTVTGHTNNYVADTSGAWNIAQDYNSSNRVDGYITDLRVTHGEAITPSSGGPTERLEASSNTKFLYSGTGHIADTHSSTASNNHSITVNGNVSTKPFSPYDYEEYDAADHGASVYFDGTGDYLRIGNNKDILNSLINNDNLMTIESWVYPTISRSGGISYLSPSLLGLGDTYFSIGLDSLTPFFYWWTGSGNTISSSNAVTLNAWSHIAVVLDANSGTNNIKIYINGTLDGQGTFTGISWASGSSGDVVKIGNGNISNANAYFQGYVQDFRITVGTAHYTSNFTPPTAPTSSSGSELHIKGTDASVIDKSQNANLKLIGNTTGSTTQAKFSNTKSMYFDGNGDYIEGPTISDLNIGTGDFTVECWLYETTTNTNKGVWDGRSTGSDTDGFTFTRINTDAFRVWSGGSLITTGSVTIQNTWNHCALVRDNGTVKIYINGNLSGTPVSNSTNFSNSAKLIIGAGKHSSGSNPTAFITGYIQDFRVSNYPRYTASDETSNIPSAPLEG